jgi:hypothetical protein
MVLSRPSLLGFGLPSTHGIRELYMGVYVSIILCLIALPNSFSNRAHKVNPSWVALGSSRGFESTESLAFMRLSVIVMDLVVYLPAVVWFTRSWWRMRSRRTQVWNSFMWRSPLNVLSRTLLSLPLHCNLLSFSLITVTSSEFTFQTKQRCPPSDKQV